MTNHPAFYEACDKYGVLVWDDFWLANPVDGPEPEDEAMFMLNAADKVGRYRHHAAIALYCGRNEGYPPESLNRALEKLCAEADGTRVYIPHSALGLVSGFGPYGARGAHYYFGHTYHTLHSERGLLNIPSLESMKKMLTKEHEWPIDEVWALHDFCRNSAQRSDEHEALMRDSYGGYDSLEDFVRIAQMVDYQNHKAMFEAVYTGKAQGMIMWMSSPAWPSMTWQTYDYWYDINGGYQGCKDANRPVNAIYECLREEIYLVNTTAETKSLTVRMELYDLDGKLLRSAEVSRLAAPDYSEAIMEAPPLDEHGSAPPAYRL
jgi:Beta-galactosidase/beta-glucuronidase